MRHVFNLQTVDYNPHWMLERQRTIVLALPLLSIIPYFSALNTFAHTQLVCRNDN